MPTLVNRNLAFLSLSLFLFLTLEVQPACELLWDALQLELARLPFFSNKKIYIKLFTQFLIRS